MANKQISDLQARTFDGDSIIPHDVENTDPSTMAQKPYLTGSATGHAVADFVGNGEIYTTDLNTVDKHINGAINELHAINGYSYDAYDDTSTYAVGDLCIYNNALYKCTTAITTAEAWNASHWTATSIADEIATKQDAFTMKALTASDVFTNTTNISQFYGYQIGKVIFITRLIVTGGTVSGSEIRYGTVKSAYVPVSATRFLWDKGGANVNVKGVIDPTNGLVIFDTDNTMTNYAYSFSYYVA